MEIQIGIVSVQGKRKTQEDRVAFQHLEEGHPEVAVADGMGGEAQGAEHADAAVEGALDYLADIHDMDWHQIARDAFNNAQARVHRRGLRQGGAALGVLFTRADDVYWATNGDIYVGLVPIDLTSGKMRYLNRIDREHRHGLLSYIGGPNPSVWGPKSMGQYRLKLGDLLFMGTDGVFDALAGHGEGFMSQIDHRYRYGRAQEVADGLVAYAQKLDDRDNATVVVLRRVL